MLVYKQKGISVLSYQCGNPDVILVKDRLICYLTCVNNKFGCVRLYFYSSKRRALATVLWLTDEMSSKEEIIQKFNALNAAVSILFISL